MKFATLLPLVPSVWYRGYGRIMLVFVCQSEQAHGNGHVCVCVCAGVYVALGCGRLRSLGQSLRPSSERITPHL